MSNQKRADARRRGLAVAAKIAGASGIALAAFGVAQAATAEIRRPAPVPIADDGARLPLEEVGKSQMASCGCSPCWGPPAPPRRSQRSSRRRPKRERA